MKLRRCKTRDQSFLQLLKKNTSKIVIEILEKFTVEERFITWHFFGIPYFVSTKKCRRFFSSIQNKQKSFETFEVRIFNFCSQIKTKDLGYFFGLKIRWKWHRSGIKITGFKVFEKCAIHASGMPLTKNDRNSIRTLFGSTFTRILRLYASNHHHKRFPWGI